MEMEDVIYKFGDIFVHLGIITPAEDAHLYSFLRRHWIREY